MPDFLTITCPHCGEDFEVSFDEADAEMILDCEVCCRPMNVRVQMIDGRPEVSGISAT